MPRSRPCVNLAGVMVLRSRIARLDVAAPLAALALALGLGGCGDGEGGGDGPVRTVAIAPPEASRPTAPPGPTLVKLERLDGRFGRHDTLIVARDGRASLVLAHGGGGFRKAACALDARSVRGLRRDLRRLPVDGPEHTVPGYADTRHAVADGVIIARPAVYTVTYRGRQQVFGGEKMAVDGAPLAARLERILTAREGRCHVTFHRP